ncbi:hypothetical protein [Desulfurivibrio sp. C05AmB]|uniref:hypothetical protein n=1 Tax=Desulfurivibrio sp. C05AmB TaxID=3374371 RepID=UPI00376F0A3E
MMMIKLSDDLIFKDHAMKICSIFLALAMIFGLFGCATTSLEKKTFKSYSVGSEASATIGEAFLVDQSGSVEKVKTWVGVLNSPDGWKVEERYSQDFVRKELIYSGKSGNTIEVSYREFRGGFAAPAFFQNLKYDLAESSIIRFQRFLIEVIHADNQTIRYKILND